MWVESKTITIKEGFEDQIVQRFSEQGAIEKFPGFIDLSVLVQKPRKGEQQIQVLIRWESEAHWKAWEKSDVHIEGHRRQRQQGKPEYVLGSAHAAYEVKAVKGPAQ